MATTLSGCPITRHWFNSRSGALIRCIDLFGTFRQLTAHKGSHVPRQSYRPT